jgi:hypothetical protein
VTVTVIVLAVWFGLSVVNQVEGPLRRALRAVNAFYLLPRYTLFAPDPVDVDFHIAHRDLQDDGSWSAWRETGLVTGRPHVLVATFWNPVHRVYAAMNQLASAITHLGVNVAASGLGLGVIAVSFPYLFVLHHVMCAAPLTGSRRQFMIVETTGAGEDRSVRIGILSEPHLAIRTNA